jgi:hypothetical protein
MKRRAIVIFHPEFDPNTKEAIELAAETCNGMKQVGLSMVPAVVDDLEQNGDNIDRAAAEKMAFGFEFKVMKVDV